MSDGQKYAYGMHREQYSKDFTDAKWDTKSKREACGLLADIHLILSSVS